MFVRTRLPRRLTVLRAGLPRRLKQILEDPGIEKETIGAHCKPARLPPGETTPYALADVRLSGSGFVRTVLNEAEFFETRPQNVICLRDLAEMGWPHIADDRKRMSHDQWVQSFAEQAFETRHAVQCKHTGFHVHSLAKETLERESQPGARTPGPCFPFVPN